MLSIHLYNIHGRQGLKLLLATNERTHENE